jgi:hypothetical protein
MAIDSNLFSECYDTGYGVTAAQERWRNIARLRPDESSTTKMTSVGFAFFPVRNRKRAIQKDLGEDFDFIPIRETEFFVLQEAPYVPEEDPGSRQLIASTFRAWEYDLAARQVGGFANRRLFTWNLMLPPRQEHQVGKRLQFSGNVRASRGGELSVVRRANCVDICVGFFDDNSPAIDARFSLADIESGAVVLEHPIPETEDGVMEIGEVELGDPIATLTKRVEFLSSAAETPSVTAPAKPIPYADHEPWFSIALDIWEQQLRAAFQKEGPVDDLGRAPLQTCVLVSRDELRTLAARPEFRLSDALVGDLLAAVGIEGLRLIVRSQNELPLFRLQLRAALRHSESGSATVLAIVSAPGNPSLVQIMYDDGSDQLVPASSMLYQHTSDGLGTVPLAVGSVVTHEEVIGDFLPRKRYGSLREVESILGDAFVELVTSFLAQTAVPADRVWEGRSGWMIPSDYVQNFGVLANPTEYLDIREVKQFQQPSGAFVLPPDFRNNSTLFWVGAIRVRNTTSRPTRTDHVGAGGKKKSQPVS